MFATTNVARVKLEILEKLDILGKLEHLEKLEKTRYSREKGQEYLVF